jgi:predicted RNA-binding protein YlqC (UPF0109 family)
MSRKEPKIEHGIDKGTRLKAFVEFMARSLVDDPSKVQARIRSGRGQLHIELGVADEDMGRVIGRGGRVANAMRSLLRVAASISDTRASLDIV